MDKEIPEWFDDLCLKATDRRMNLTDAKALWRELSKPKNLAKMPETKVLIEAVKLYLKQGTVPLGLDLETALKPFEGV